MATYRNALVATWQSIKTKGWKKTWWEVLTNDQPRVGKLVGTDQFGNEYYENRADISMRDRWIIYAKADYDGSQVPPEWHQWVHRMTDDIPSSSTTPKPFFAGEPFENMTGTSGAFKTYSTVRPKLESWTPEVRPRGQ